MLSYPLFFPSLSQQPPFIERPFFLFLFFLALVLGDISGLLQDPIWGPCFLLYDLERIIAHPPFLGLSVSLFLLGP